MSLNSRAKGKRGELELVDELGRLGMLARRCAQYCGNSGEAADVLVTGTGLHLEVKRVERVTLHEWVAQASRDAHGKEWIIVTKQNRGPWLVVQTLEQWAGDSSHAAQAIEARRTLFREAIPPHAEGS
jgi:Holliday junction resolvase